MPKPDALDDLVSEFVTRLRDIIRDQARQALDGSFSPATSRPAAKNGAHKTNGERAKGEKRHASELGAIQEKFVAFVSKNPGLRIEQINKELGTSTKDLALPIRKLIENGTLKGTGQKRSRTYAIASKRGRAKRSS